MNIEQIMSRPVITCRATDSVNFAAGLMWENDCGALPVVDEQGVAIGMITDRDICMAVYTSGRSIQSIAVREAMASKLYTCLPTDSLADAEQTMARAQIRRLPVLDGQGRVIGLVSMNDIVRATGKKDGVTALATMAAICAPRRRALSTVPRAA